MSPVRHYCTYFDQLYLSRALALYHSLKQHTDNFYLWALCFDDISYNHLKELHLPEILPISHEEFTRGDEPLKIARENRSLVEYYFTCSPSLPLFVFKNDPNVEQITYLDADIYFYNDPELIFAEIGSASVAIIPHRFPKNLRWLEDFGKFNVSWITFRKDEEGLRCLTCWRSQCLEWCYDRIEGTKYADQGYLNDWPETYRNLVVIQQKGANLAPWNISNYHITSQDGYISISGDPLVFFHFQNLARIRPRLYILNFTEYTMKASRFVKKIIYRSYINALNESESGRMNMNNLSRIRYPGNASFISPSLRGLSLMTLIRSTKHLVKEIILGDYIYLWGGR